MRREILRFGTPDETMIPGLIAEEVARARTVSFFSVKLWPALLLSWNPEPRLESCVVIKRGSPESRDHNLDCEKEPRASHINGQSAQHPAVDRPKVFTVLVPQAASAPHFHRAKGHASLRARRSDTRWAQITSARGRQESVNTGPYQLHQPTHLG
jgi:hypothetical protein